MSLTQFMSMSLPIVGVTPGGGSGNSWGPLLTTSLGQIDVHDHSPGKGAPLVMTSGSFKVATDLGFAGHSLFAVDNIQAIGQITALGLTGSLTQIIVSASFSGTFSSGTLSGSTFLPTGSFTPLSLYSASYAAAFVGVGGIQVLTNSFGQVLISGTVGDDRYASFILAQPDAEDPNYRVITGSGGTSLIDGGAGGFMTVSSSIGAGRDAAFVLTATADGRAPNARTITGSGGVSVIDGGPGGNLTVSGSFPQISNLSGLGGTVVTPNGSLYTVSSSAPPWTSIQGQGGTSVSITGATVIVSSSAPLYNDFYGIGGISVTPTAGQLQISGSQPTISNLSGTAGIIVTPNGSLYLLSQSLPPPNYVTALAGTQSGVSTAQVTAPNITKLKNGVVELNGMLVVNPTMTESGSAQLFRDSTPIGPSQQLMMSVQSPKLFIISWIDVLPDSSSHAYSLQVSGTLSTFMVQAGQGSITAKES